MPGSTSILVWYIVRFAIAGALSTLSNLGTFHVLNSVAGLWYLASSIVAFLVGFVISFILQKFWTFHDHRIDVVHGQLTRYTFLAGLNLGLNTGIVFILVEYIHAIPVLAQAIAALLIACETFLAYRLWIFRKHPELGSEAFKKESRISNL